MTLLLASLVALMLGPLTFTTLTRRQPLANALDGFVTLAVAGIVLMHLLPHGLEVAGWPAALVAAAGFALPFFAERGMKNVDPSRASTWMLGFVLLGLAAHAALDGAALVEHHAHGHGAHDPNAELLAMAVVLHRLPVGLVVWWLVRPRFGRRWAITLLGVIAAATVGGFLGAEAILRSGLTAEGLAFLQALVAGSLLHVVVHHPPIGQGGEGGHDHEHGHHDERDRRSARLAGGIGGLAAIGLLVVVRMSEDGHAGGGMGFGETFVTLAAEAAPALLIAFAAAGILRAFMTPNTRRWLAGGSSVGQTLRGTLFGLPLPICSCGVLPLYQGLVQSGIPATAATAFLVATPELGLDAILVSIPLLGTDLTLARLAAAFLVAILVGWLVGRWIQKRHAADTHAAPADEALPPLPQRLRDGVRYGLTDLVDDTMPWILLGLVLAALVEPALDREWLAALPAGVDVVALAAIGIPLYICASGSTPLVAILVFHGVSPGAAIAFLLTGPATNVTTFGVLSRLHGPRAAAVFGVVVAASAIGLGLLVNALLPGFTPVALDRAAADGPGTFQLVCLGALALLATWSLLRRGPRELIDEMTPGTHDHGDDDGGGGDACCGSSCGGTTVEKAPESAHSHG